MVNETDEFSDPDTNNEDFSYGRTSLHVSDDIESDGSLRPQLLESRNWSWNYMKEQLRVKNLESLYSRYHQVLHKGYFCVFLLSQTILTIIHVGILLAKEVNDPQHKSLPDIILYISFTLLLWHLMLIVSNKNLVEKFPWLPHVVSCFAIFIVVLIDIALPIYHTSVFHSRGSLRPAYATHALLACYIFLPLHNNITSIILGLGITSFHLVTLITVTFKNSCISQKQIASEIIFFLCVNGLGLYYRLTNEMILKRSFLDRRACVEFTMKLNYEKEQEEQLLLSILPWHIAARVREDLRKKILLKTPDEPMTQKPFKELYIESHDNVSILYADVVNYTKMTSSLPANKLVETLNELFGRFDGASEKHKVLRIKFLGDCYYCASGIPQPNPDHAKSCVDLGLDMTTIIKEVRQDRKLDIDMRIGVHSGSILCGLIGRCKWQYDIWSRDVVIANRMEQSGKPGMVHITKQTLDQLGDCYKVEPGDGHLKDELLAKYNIRTFLIRPQEEVSINGPKRDVAQAESGAMPRSSIFTKRESIGPRKSKSKSNNYRRGGADLFYNLRGVISGEGNMAISRRRTAFMNNNLIMYQQRLKMADFYMEKVIDNLPLTQYIPWFQCNKLNPFCLTFARRNWAFSAMNQPDPLFKYYIVGSLFVSFCMSAMQFLGLSRLHWISWLVFSLSTLGLILLLPLSWTHYFWNAFKDPQQQLEHIPKPENKILFLLYKGSEKIIWNCYFRTVLYLVICFLLTASSFADLINHAYGIFYCTDGSYKEKMLNIYGSKTCCNSPWHITESCTLAVLMSFLFIRIHFNLKFLVGIIILGIYSWCIFQLEITGGDTWNPNLEPEFAHILSIVFVIVGLHLTDRQTEFINNLDDQWKQQLSHEKDEAERTRSVNLMLLHNILPIHVAKVYLNTNRVSKEHYHENYGCVAVMFASLTNLLLYEDKDTDQSQIRSLEILNRVICDFDDVLFETPFNTVEKIKLAGSTYIAACGLHPGRMDSNDLKGTSCSEVVVTLVEFAANIMRRLQKINRNFNTNFRLRVGISHGPVTAGVVGSQKPLYDIWGNTVNVASRMDSTGEPGKIQVTASTAIILQEKGVQSTLRGPIFVKGKGILETYFIALSNDYHIQRKSREYL